MSIFPFGFGVLCVFSPAVNILRGSEVLGTRAKSWHEILQPYERETASTETRALHLFFAEAQRLEDPQSLIFATA